MEPKRTTSSNEVVFKRRLSISAGPPRGLPLHMSQALEEVEYVLSSFKLLHLSKSSKQVNLTLTIFLWQGARIKPEHKEMVTVYFSDIVGFTKLSSTIDSSKVTDLLQRLYNRFDDLADQYEIHSLETIGDGKT